MDSFWTAIILGVVEGITEFLPVSSTGHLLIAQHLLGVHQSDAFNVLIQVGPIVAVTLVFWRRVVALLTGFRDPGLRDELVKLAASFFLTAMAGFVAKKLGMELPETVLPIAVATLAGAGVIFWVERRTQGRELGETVTWPVVVAVAAGQMLAAVFPGTSRSGAAVIAALWLGLSRPAAVRFAFLVGIPTMFAAGALQIHEAIGAGQTAELLTPQAMTAFAAATLTAWLAVIWLLRFVQGHTFVPFAWYRIAMGVALIVLMAAGMVR
ncbi:MAG: undecaprenyl-diphosphate phosphatase [Candidatus Anammoximicrobium sp.]|nr:undecaprenyl-diphosphate phosphatase [Candidatus Anammoximicrobium sp.]